MRAPVPEPHDKERRKPWPAQSPKIEPPARARRCAVKNWKKPTGRAMRRDTWRVRVESPDPAADGGRTEHDVRVRLIQSATSESDVGEMDVVEASSKLKLSEPASALLPWLARTFAHRARDPRPLTRQRPTMATFARPPSPCSRLDPRT